MRCRGPLQVAAASSFAAAMMATFMTAVETTIVATAMPTIVADLGDFHLFSWVFAAYLLAQAVSIPIYGRLADLYGRKRIFFVGAGVFLVGSTLCGFAHGMLSLIAFRALQGIGAGAVQPVAYTIVGDIYSPTERARVQGFLSSVFGFAAVVGPTLGAFLVEHADWSIVFWINLPVGALAIAMLATFYHETPHSRPPRIDYLASILLMVGGGALMMAMIQGGSPSPWMLAACLTVGVGALAGLVRRERHTEAPMLPFRLWRSSTIALGNLGSFAIGAVMISVSAFLPIYVQGRDGPGRRDHRRGARHHVHKLGRSQHRFGKGHAPHQLPVERHDRRCGADPGQRRPDRPDADARPDLGRGGRAAGRHRHGFLQHHLSRVGPGGSGAARSRRRHRVEHVHAHRRPVGRCGAVRRLVNLGLQRHGAQADVAERLMAPLLRQSLGAAEIVTLTEAMASALRNVHIVGALIGLVVLALATRLPRALSPATLPDEKPSGRRS